MDPILIVGLAPLGVALLIGLVALFGGNKVAAFSSEDEALARFKKDFETWSDDQIILSDDKTIALLPATGSDKVGLVYAVGDCFTTRIITRADIETAATKSGEARVHFHDFSAPDITVPAALAASLQATA